MQETPAGRIQASDLGKLKLIKEEEENQLKIYHEEVEQVVQKGVAKRSTSYLKLNFYRKGNEKTTRFGKSGS